jgi:hypothetical protein
MKKIIALTCLLSAFVLNAKAEVKVLLATRTADKQTLSVEEGQVARCLSWVHSYSSAQGELEIEIKGKIISLPQNSYIDADKLPVIPGPAKIILRSSANYASMATFKIVNDLSGGDGNNVTVLPKETENMTLILESSDDMVKWTADTLGDKPKANRKKFYRLRAVKK